MDQLPKLLTIAEFARLTRDERAKYVDQVFQYLQALREVPPLPQDMPKPHALRERPKRV